MMILIVLFWQIAFATCLSPSAQSYEMAELNESATLTCQVRCSGSTRWIMDSKGSTVAQCNQTKCHSEEGFHISHDQYLIGNLSLTIRAADYSKRSWYTCECDGKQIAQVYLRIQRVNHSIQIENGSSFTLDFFISERVKITFNRTSDDGSQNSVTLYESGENKVRFHPDYGKRTSSKSCFILSNVSVSDGGVYTLFDTDNEEIIATYTLTVTNKPSWWWTDAVFQGYNGLIIGLVLGLILTAILNYMVFPRILNCWTYLRSRVGSDERAEEKTVHRKELLSLDEK